MSVPKVWMSHEEISQQRNIKYETMNSKLKTAFGNIPHKIKLKKYALSS